MAIRKHNFVEGEFYHIYAHSVGDLKLFPKESDYQRFLSLIFAANGTKPLPHLSRKLNGRSLASTIIEGGVDLGEPLVNIISFSLMPTHFHFVLEERGDSNISRYMHKLLVSHSKHYNLKYERRGHLFENKFNSKHIDSNEYLLIVSSYIHKNAKDLPGWKNREDKYPWSSYQDYVLENRWKHLLKKDIIDDQFKNTKDYKRFVEEHYQECLI